MLHMKYNGNIDFCQVPGKTWKYALFTYNDIGFFSKRANFGGFCATNIYSAIITFEYIT